MCDHGYGHFGKKFALNVTPPAIDEKLKKFSKFWYIISLLVLVLMMFVLIKEILLLTYNTYS